MPRPKTSNLPLDLPTDLIEILSEKARNRCVSLEQLLQVWIVDAVELNFAKRPAKRRAPRKR